LSGIVVSDNMDVGQIVLEDNLNIVSCDGILNMICTYPSHIKGAKKMKFDKAEISGLLVLFIGVGLLAFTFVNAYWFLSADVGIVANQDVIAAFGKAIAPLMVTVIHVMYLGIMGWIGSLLTLRGIPLLARAKTPVAQPTPEQPVTTKVAQPQPPPKPEVKPKEEPKKEPEKKPETGITIEVRSPQETKETPQKPAQPEQPKQQTQK
jgi:hypothetical protein